MAGNDDRGSAQGLGAWLHRRLDPQTSLSEVLFGLIMTLTFTLGAGLLVADEGREGARQLLVAALGCNVAWGVIDAVCYLVDVMFEREQGRRLRLRIRSAPDLDSATALTAEHLDGVAAGAFADEERAAIYRRIAVHLRETAPAPNRVSSADLVAATLSGLLVVLTTLPAAVPFMFIDDAWIALRLSNAVLLALLFASGWWWARYTTLRPLWVGVGFLLGGFVLVLVAIALGG